MPASTPRRRFSRLVASAAFAALAVTACNPSAGETVIVAPGEPAEAQVVSAPTVAPTTAPIVVPAEVEAAAAPTAVPAAAVATASSDDATDVVVIEDAVTVVDDEPTAVETDVETADFAQSGNCMDGQWMAAPGEIELYFDTIALSTATPDFPAIEMDASGHIIIVLENGHYIYDARIVNQIAIDGFPTASVVEGITQGDYYYENGFIVGSETFNDISAYVDLGGTQIDATELGQDFGEIGVFHEAPYDCNGDNPSIYFDVAPGVARYEMKFIPWDGSSS